MHSVAPRVLLPNEEHYLESLPSELRRRDASHTEQPYGLSVLVESMQVR